MKKKTYLIECEENIIKCFNNGKKELKGSKSVNNFHINIYTVKTGKNTWCLSGLVEINEDDLNIKVEGCYWGASYEYRTLDFKNPAEIL